MLGRTRHVHFVGIGGSGMSGIAEVLLTLGYRVSGSDLARSEVTARLETLGAQVYEGHAAAHVGEADVVVVSSAVRPTNPEVVEARRRHIPVIPRAEMLAELMRLRFSIAVAGAHGKTTTTSMIAFVLERAGLDPTAVIGGRFRPFGSSARLGTSEYLVAEADESDRSFLKLLPAMAVITNIDREHLEAYRDFADLQDAFVEFANRVPFYGTVVACADDPTVRTLLPRLTRRVVTYGIDSTDADFRAAEMERVGLGSRVVVRHQPARREHGRPALEEDVTLGTLHLQVPGRHNVLNAMAAVAAACELDVPFARIVAALGEFRGADRRFQICGEVDGVTVVDDYGHHPAEIAAVVQTARAVFDRRVVVVFQPHRYTRTRQLLGEFGPALAGASEIVLTDIYGAGEDPIPGVSVEALAAAIRQSAGVPVHLVKRLEEVVPAVVGVIRPGDVVITLGAGSIGTVGARLVTALEHRAASRADRAGSQPGGD